MTIPKTTMMLGASSARAKRPSRVRARQLVPLARAIRPAAGTEAPSAISGRYCHAPVSGVERSTPPNTALRRRAGVEGRGRGVQCVLGTLAAEQRVLNLHL